MRSRPFAIGRTERPDDAERRRLRMVERQLRARGITDACVLAAMGAIPRERFVPAEQRSKAYRDRALAIAEDQTISQPWIVAAMAQLLSLDGHERVLEVGTGSGYGAAVLSRCAHEVVTIERHPALADVAREVLSELGHANVEVRAGDGTLGAPDRAPFDAIVVTATAQDSIPTALVDQLAPRAPLVAPLRRDGHEQLMRFRDGRAEAIAPVRFVPLVSD